jgi:hypothetical protein
MIEISGFALALDLLHPSLWGNNALRSEAAGVLLSARF